MDNSDSNLHAGKNIWAVLHIGVLYFFLVLFIFGSLYHKLLIRDLGFGLFFFISWVFCFLLVPWLVYDINFALFYTNKQDVTIKKSPYYLSIISYFILQLILVLIALQILSFNLMIINLLGISVVLLYCSTLIIKKILPAEGRGDFGFAILKLIVSIYVSWFLLYVGCLILIMNFSPYTEGVMIQVNLLLIILTTLCLTNAITRTRAAGLKLSFIVGFFIIALMLAYLAQFIR